MKSLAEFFEVPEGVEFKIGNIGKYKIENNVLMLFEYREWKASDCNVNTAVLREIKIIPPKKTISEDEKVILRNLPSEFTWIARDEDGGLYIFDEIPCKKYKSASWEESKNLKSLPMFKHLFQCIKWTDGEPTKIYDLLKEVQCEYKD